MVISSRRMIANEGVQRSKIWGGGGDNTRVGGCGQRYPMYYVSEKGADWGGGRSPSDVYDYVV